MSEVTADGSECPKSATEAMARQLAEPGVTGKLFEFDYTINGTVITERMRTDCWGPKDISAALVHAQRIVASRIIAVREVTPES